MEQCSKSARQKLWYILVVSLLILCHSVILSMEVLTFTLLFCCLAGTSQVVLGDLVSTKVDAAKRMVDSLTSEHNESSEEALDCDQVDDTAVVDLPAERSDLVKVSFYCELLLFRPFLVENFCYHHLV